MPTIARRTPVRIAALVALVVAAYAAGLATGVTGWRAPHQSASRGTDLDKVRDRLAAQALRKVDERQLDRAAVAGMLSALRDPWSTYYDSDDYARYQESLDDEYSGVGLVLRQRSGGAVFIAAVEPGSPAAAAGVSTGDLTAVDGRPTVGLTASQVAEALRGKGGTIVAITLRAGGRERTVRLVRARLVSRDVAVDWLSPHVVRITISAFTRGVGHQVRDAVDRAAVADAGGIVLDLRGNPGGLLDEAVEAASAFLDGGPVVSYARRGEPAQVLRATRGADTATPVAVLVDGGTASAAEVLAGALQDRGRAVVIGTRTFGKGTVQQPIHLPGGSVAQMTVARYWTPAGRSLDGVGLEPDIAVPPGSAPAVAQQRALEVLTGLQADAGTGGRG
jgi:carboxyl-terminal processing protease